MLVKWVCVGADPYDEDGMYIKVSKDGHMPHYITLRSTSQLEGYHPRLNAALKAATTSPKLADVLIKLLNFRYNVSAGVRNKGEHDFKMFKFPLLHRIKLFCNNKGWQDPLPEFRLLPCPDPNKFTTNEWFGVASLHLPGVPTPSLNHVQQSLSEHAVVEDAVVDKEQELEDIEAKRMKCCKTCFENFQSSTRWHGGQRSPKAV
jgi:hypothetical protein